MIDIIWLVFVKCDIYGKFLVKSAVRLRATCRMSFTFHAQCLVIFHQGFSSTVIRVQKSESDLIRPKLVLDVALGDIKHGFVFDFITGQRCHVAKDKFEFTSVIRCLKVPCNWISFQAFLCDDGDSVCTMARTYAFI